MAGANHSLAQSRESAGGDAAGRHAVLLENFRQRKCGARRGISLLPLRAIEFACDRFDLGTRARFRRGERLGEEAPVPEKALRVAHAADLQRFEPLRFQAATDDEFGRAAADVDAKARRLGRRQHVCNAEIDEARFLVTGNDVDRKAQRGLGPP